MTESPWLKDTLLCGYDLQINQSDNLINVILKRFILVLFKNFMFIDCQLFFNFKKAIYF